MQYKWFVLYELFLFKWRIFFYILFLKKKNAIIIIITKSLVSVSVSTMSFLLDFQ